MRFRTLCILAISFLPTVGFSFIDAKYYGLGTDFGNVSSLATKDTELDKKGTTYSFYGGLSLAPIPNSTLTTSIGLRGYSLSAKTVNRKQTVDVKSGLFLAEGRYAFNALEVGAWVNVDYGTGTTLKVVDREKLGLVVSVGPQLAYRLFQAQYASPLVYLATLHNIVGSDQRNTSFVVGAQWWMNFDRKPAPITPEPTPEPVAEPIAEPVVEEVKVVSIRFKPDVFQFELNKDVLLPKSKIKAEKIATVLKKYVGSWSLIEIEGHTDTSGRAERNTVLSDIRAKAILNLFVASDLPKETMTAKGFGSSRLLPDLPENSEQHRRVELRFHDLSNHEAIAKEIEEFIVIEKM